MMSLGREWEKQRKQNNKNHKKYLLLISNVFSLFLEWARFYFLIQSPKCTIQCQRLIHQIKKKRPKHSYYTRQSSKMLVNKKAYQIRCWSMKYKTHIRQTCLLWILIECRLFSWHSMCLFFWILKLFAQRYWNLQYSFQSKSVVFQDFFVSMTIPEK